MQKLILDFVKVAEKAAIASYEWVGKGDEKSADSAATNAMRLALDEIDISGIVVIGEGERDQAPMLYIGEELGKGGVKLDIAVDPLEGTTICANNDRGSLSVIVFGEDKTLLNAPDIYMNKIAIGKDYPGDFIDIDVSVKENIRKLAKCRNLSNSEISVTILKRERHLKLIEDVRETGAKIKLISDGDIAAVLEVALGESDIYVGIGGAPEGVIAAAALNTLGGQMSSRLIFNDEAQKNRAITMGIDPNYKYKASDLSKSHSIFCASGITDGDLLKGVHYQNGYICVSSIIIDSYSQSIKYITSKYKN